MTSVDDERGQASKGRLTARRVGGLAVAAILIVLTLAACNPSATRVEARVVVSMHKTLFGRDPSGQVTCAWSVKTAEDQWSQEWESTCRLDGRDYRVLVMYSGRQAPSGPYHIAYAHASLGTWPHIRDHGCTFRLPPEAGADWYQSDTCTLIP